MAATRISTIRKIGSTLCLALSVSIVATSSSFAYSARARQMCTGDAYRLCSSEIPNIGRIIACMRRNKASLSTGCRAAMDQEDSAATKTKPVQAPPVAQRPATASPVEPPAAIEAKPAQTGPVEHAPAAASRVERPAATGTEPVQAAPVEQRSTTATSVEVKPVEARTASSGKSMKPAHRKRKHLTAERRIHREFTDIEAAIGFVLPLVIQFYW